jgi:hypothetical protein
MRMIFGVLSLLVVLAIVGSVAKKQLQALRLTAPVTAAASAPGDRAGRFDAFSGAVAADPNMTVPQQSQAIQKSMRDDVVRALEKGEDRSAKEQP